MINSYAIFTLGVGNYRVSEMEGIASRPIKDFLYTVEDYNSLNKIINTIANNTCS